MQKCYFLRDMCLFQAKKRWFCKAGQYFKVVDRVA